MKEVYAPNGTPQEELRGMLRALEDMNPDIPEERHRHLLNLAAKCGPSFFDEAAAQVAHLLELANMTTAERVGREILGEYYRVIEQSARRLLEAGEISAASSAGQNAGLSTALVLYSQQDYSALDRCKILSHADIPEPLVNAADSYRRRIEVVDSVGALGFEVLNTLDGKQFQIWAACYVKDHRGQLPPTVLRDILTVLRLETELQPPLLELLQEWCADGALLDQWPLVTRRADRLLSHIALKQWLAQNPKPRNGALLHLKLILGQSLCDDARLLAWLTNTLQTFGESVERFIALDMEETPQEQAWWHTALVAELRTMQAMYVPIMVVVDHLLTEPDGTAKVAMAFLGIVGNGLDEWEKRIRRLSENIIRRAFLIDLKAGRTPVETIRKYTFGDQFAFNLICNELDLLSQQFESMAQRDAVVRKLSYYYASYRRGPMLGIEVAKRYRHIARVLHEDFLRTRLSSAEYEAFAASGFIQELYSMCTRAKRFLDHRRALRMTLEEMVASELEFSAEARTRRLAIIRRLIDCN